MQPNIWNVSQVKEPAESSSSLKQDLDTYILRKAPPVFLDLILKKKMCTAFGLMLWISKDLFPTEWNPPQRSDFRYHQYWKGAYLWRLDKECFPEFLQSHDGTLNVGRGALMRLSVLSLGQPLDKEHKGLCWGWEGQKEGHIPFLACWPMNSPENILQMLPPHSIFWFILL